MNKKTECSLVQDLLPNYLDGLTTGETNDFIQRHLDQCEDCYQLKRTMQRPLDPDEQARADMLDLLRRSRIRRKRGIRLLLLLAAATIALLILPLPREIDHSVTATVWTANQPEDDILRIPVHVKGTYFDYLLRTDRFEGTFTAPEATRLFDGSKIHVALDDSGLMTSMDEEGFLHIRGFLHTDAHMQNFIIGLYDENGRWSGNGGRILTAPANNREEAVAKTREIIQMVGNQWLMSGNWEGSPNNGSITGY